MQRNRIKTSIYLLVLLIPNLLFAHQDTQIAKRKKNVFMQYVVAFERQEYDEQCEILFYLTRKLVEERNYTGDVLISFDHDYLDWDSTYYALGFGDFKILGWDKGIQEFEGSGIKLIMQDSHIDIQKILTIIDNAISNVSKLKNEQKEHVHELMWIVDGKSRYDTLLSISAEKVAFYSTNISSVVERIVGQKTLREPENENRYSSLDYYYQNNQFHFYSSDNPSTVDPQFLGSRSGDTLKLYTDNLLVVNEISQIFGDSYYGQFVFINDSVFHYIKRKNNQVYGPFKVDSLILGRPPVHKWTRDFKPMLRYTLYFDSYKNYPVKALFVPDSNLLISNYHSIESEFVSNLVANQQTLQRIKKEEADFRWLVGLLMVSGLIIFCLLLLLLLRRKH